MSWRSEWRRWLKGLLGLEPASERRIPAFAYAGPPAAAPAGADNLSGVSGGMEGRSIGKARSEAERAHAPLPAPAAAAGPRVRLRRDSIFAAFNTAVPVVDRHGLAGRQDELCRLVEGVIQQRKHAVVFGNRGSGKTSLARVFGDLADEGGCIALYGSADTDADLDDLFRPFLAELAEIGAEAGAAPIDAPSPDGRADDRIADAQQLAQRLHQAAPDRCLLILDEFDRVRSDKVKRQVAALMKLLTDLHAPIHVVLVGIAGDVDGLLEAHPSLRRHLVVQPVLPIAHEALVGLLDLCARQAGIGMPEAPAELIAAAAMGSPFHARLFGMHAALLAEGAGRPDITAADAAEGLALALAEWRDLSPRLYQLFDRTLADAGSMRGMIALVGVLAAQSPLLSLDRVTEAGTDLFGEAMGGREGARRALVALGPAFTETQTGTAQFEDTLAPQFLVLMAKDGDRGRIRPTAATRPADRKAALQILEGMIDHDR